MTWYEALYIALLVILLGVQLYAVESNRRWRKRNARMISEYWGRDWRECSPEQQWEALALGGAHRTEEDDDE